MTMTKQDFSRMSWRIVAFVIGLICATLSSAEDAMKICQRIQSNDLKIRTMGLVGELFNVLTSEGHLFYLPKANLRDVDTSSTTLTIDHVPISAHRVFGVVLDYSARPGYLFFLLVDGQSKNELLLKLQVESRVEFQAFHLDLTKSRKGQNLFWTEKRFKPNKKFDFNPVFVSIYQNSQCAEAITTFVMHHRGYPNWHLSVTNPTHRICLSGDSLNIEWLEKEGKGDSRRFTRVQESILAGFLVSQLGDNGPLMRFYLVENGSLLCLNEATNYLKYHYQLSNFIRCGPSFVGSTQIWIPSEVTSSVDTNTNGTTITTIGGTEISGWIIAAAILVNLATIAIIWVFVMKKRKRKKKRIRRVSRNLNSYGSSATGSSNVGSSSVLSSGSSALFSSSASSGLPSVASSAFSSSNASNIQGPVGKAIKSKAKHRSFKDIVSSVFKKNRKKNAEQRSKVKKAKENEKKKKKDESMKK